MKKLLRTISLALIICLVINLGGLTALAAKHTNKPSDRDNKNISRTYDRDNNKSSKTKDKGTNTTTAPATNPAVLPDPTNNEVPSSEPATNPAVLPDPTNNEVPSSEPAADPEVLPDPVENEVASSAVDVTKFGANGNDQIDDTKAIQSALDQYDQVYIPDGTYLINVEESLQLRSKQTLILSKSAILQAIPTKNGNSAVIKIENVNAVSVSGGQIIGERNGHIGTSGEWGMGISIESGAENISISDITIRDCWGDGIYLGGNLAVNNITINNVICDNNRRQGLSITNATKVTVSNSIFRNTQGIAPSAGIDIEPNPGQITEDITITKTQCYGNAGSGIDLMGINEKIQRVNISDCTFRDNELSGITIDNANELSFSNTTTSGNYMGIEIPRDVTNAEFNNMIISNNLYRGVSIVATSQREGIANISFNSSEFYNNSINEINKADGVRIDNYDTSGYIKTITFNDCHFYDNQALKTQRYGITVGSSENMSSITMDKSCTFTGNLAGTYLGL